MSLPAGLGEAHLDLKSGPEAELAETVEYSPQERLVLLIDAIEQATAVVTEIEAATVISLEEMPDEQRISGILFVAPQDNAHDELMIKREDVARRKETASRLKALLKELKEAAYAP